MDSPQDPPRPDDPSFLAGLILREALVAGRLRMEFNAFSGGLPVESYEFCANPVDAICEAAPHTFENRVFCGVRVYLQPEEHSVNIFRDAAALYVSMVSINEELLSPICIVLPVDMAASWMPRGLCGRLELLDAPLRCWLLLGVLYVAFMAVGAL